MIKDKILLFTDGACSGNPGPGGWGAILVSPKGRVKELGGREPKTTNNQMELLAAIEGLQELLRAKTLSTKEICLLTDSKYVIQGITQWIHGWKARGWKNQSGAPVANQNLWERLDALTYSSGLRLEWRYIPGHSGFPGNERCDSIAVAHSKGEDPALFDGPLKNYPLKIMQLPEAGNSAGVQKTKFSPVYLSLVEGTVYRDSDWKSCESRTKGKRGVKFKKAESPEEETQILKAWGKV